METELTYSPGILAPLLGIKPAPPALEGESEVLTTGPLREVLINSFLFLPESRLLGLLNPSVCAPVSPRPSALTSRLTAGLSPASVHTHPTPSGTPSGFLFSTRLPTADGGWRCLPGLPAAQPVRAGHPHSRSSPPALPVSALTSWWCSAYTSGLAISSRGPGTGSGRAALEEERGS